MDTEIWVLALSALSIGFFHTILGPDHIIPFVLLSRSRNWTTKKTMMITSLCGLGHVASSVILGLLGVFFGWTLNSISIFENYRGNIAAWMLIIFGGAYLTWGLIRAYKKKPHTHWHSHLSGMVHKHPHLHAGEHAHVHQPEGKLSITPWILFLIFIFGPCEPLIPLLVYPAAQESMFGLILVSTVFGIATISTMMAVVFLATKGTFMISLGKYEPFSHAIAGAFILLSGIGVQFFGL
jgi:sulfite exporter TauE/SafE